MSQSNLIILAKQGQPNAIATLLNQQLQQFQITAKVTRQKNALYILLLAPQVPSQERFATLIQKGLTRLEMASIVSVRVYGRQLGKQHSAWYQDFRFPIPPHSGKHKLQSKTVTQTSGNREIAKSRNRVSSPVIPNPSVSPASPPQNSELNVVHSPNLKLGKIGLLILGSISFLLGSSWDFLSNPETYSKLGMMLPITETIPTVNRPAPAPLEALQPLPRPDYAALSELVNTAIANNTITLKAVGDIVPGTNFPTNRLPLNQQQLFQSVQPYLSDADIVFGNFESTLTDYSYSSKDVRKSNVFAFRTPPSYAKLLKDAGFDVLSVANNHSTDFFNRGFEDTIQHIENAGMKATGRKGEITYLNVKGIPIAFIGFSTYNVHNSIHDLETAQSLVQEASENANFVIISVHAGAEGTGATRVRNQTEYFYGENRGNLVLFSRSMIEAG
ncbi:MAG: CapA family protein, partial [Chroococcales cyanobacterium]